MPSLLRSSLRLIGVLLALLSLSTLASVGYSLYREYSLLSSGLDLRLEQRASPEGLTMTIAGSLPNGGLYPLGASLSVILLAEGQELGRGAAGPIDIPPGSQARLDLNVTANPLALSNSTLLRRLAMNGTRLELIVGLGMALRPLAAASASVRAESYFPPPLGNLSIGRPRLEVQGDKLTLRFPVSFVNYSPLGFMASFYATASKDGRPLASSAPVSVLASPGQTSSMELVLTFNALGAPPPPYLLELHVRLGGGEFTLSQEVSP